MKIVSFFILLLSLCFSTTGICQKKLDLKWVIESCTFDNEELKIDSITTTLNRKKYKEIIFWKNDSIKLRASFRYSTRFNRVVKIFKVRFDIFENNKWYKAPISIDTHGGRRFRINRVQCWGRTSFGYNARYPYEQYCQCYGELKGKNKYQIKLNSTVVLSK
jgi:hypothetical protein